MDRMQCNSSKKDDSFELSYLTFHVIDSVKITLYTNVKWQKSTFMLKSISAFHVRITSDHRLVALTPATVRRGVSCARKIIQPKTTQSKNSGYIQLTLEPPGMPVPTRATDWGQASLLRSENLMTTDMAIYMHSKNKGYFPFIPCVIWLPSISRIVVAMRCADIKSPFRKVLSFRLHHLGIRI